MAGGAIRISQRLFAGRSRNLAQAHSGDREPRRRHRKRHSRPQGCNPEKGVRRVGSAVAARAGVFGVRPAVMKVPEHILTAVGWRAAERTKEKIHFRDRTSRLPGSTSPQIYATDRPHTIMLDYVGRRRTRELRRRIDYLELIRYRKGMWLFTTTV